MLSSVIMPRLLDVSEGEYRRRTRARRRRTGGGGDNGGCGSMIVGILVLLFLMHACN